MMTEQRYYVYRHIRPDTNEPFYIGIGTKPFIYASEKTEYRRALDTKHRSSLWYRVFNKVNGQIRYEIIFESANRESIIEKEKEFIQLYGKVCKKSGSLVNFTDGGEGGMLGHKKSQESINKTRIKLIGSKRSLESRRKMSEAKKGLKPRLGVKLSDETKAKISKAHKGVGLGRKHSPETIEKMRKFHQNEEYKAKMRMVLLGNKFSLGHSPSQETRQKLREKQLGRKFPPRTEEQRKRISDAVKLWHKNRRLPLL